MAIFETGETRLAYDDVGAGPAIVFNHGFLLNRSMFAAQVDALRDRYRCISWDQRGFGETGRVARSFSYWDSARDALALLDHLGVEQAVWVGLSQGGFLAMRAALLAPARVRGLVLMSTRSGLDDDQTVASFRDLATEWAAHGAANVQADLASLLLGFGVDDRQWRSRWATMANDSLRAPIDALIGRDDLTSRLPEIRCPAVVVHGDSDPAIDFSHGQQLAADLPGAGPVVRVAGAGHAPPMSHPAEVTSAMETFLTGLAGSTDSSERPTARVDVQEE